MADRLDALWRARSEVEVPLWQEPVQGVTRSHPAPPLDSAGLDALLCPSLKAGLVPAQLMLCWARLLCARSGASFADWAHGGTLLAGALCTPQQ